MKSILRYLLEIVTIFIGITLSFAFEEYRDSHKKMDDKIESLKSLLLDVESKKREIDGDIIATKRLYTVLDSCLMLAKNNQKLPVHLAKDMHWAMSNDYSLFVPSTPSYSSLSATGIWQQLPDSLRREIYHTYNTEFGFLELMYRKQTDYSSYVQEHYFIPRGLIHRKGINREMTVNLKEYKPYYDLINESLKDSEFRTALMFIRNQYFETEEQMETTSRGLGVLSVKVRNTMVNLK